MFNIVTHPVLPSSMGGAGGLSDSFSKLGPLDLKWCDEGEGGVGEMLGVGGKVVVFTLVESGLTGVLSSPLAFSSVVFPFCHGVDLFFTMRAPFLAFLNRTDVRRPTPATVRVGGVPRGVTS